ncbi:DUF1854 domain-containing protein [Paenibacillus methanolicus]|uniref:Uncharacterized protein DUF1854 n=1 Tax=Paenibacillus methanolicus TaxID=582686 RepID=A0A5S5CE91_9BACL|nr:DUF1854 domain-containing protein [Paenibacillus methanolicus]TYP76822.1 uncharacterized protein DUF1854 [Paenibacillus methanolicus]
MADRYDIRLLKPDDVYLSRGEGGVLQGVVDGKPYDELIVHRTFPFRHPSAYISIRTTKDEELGIVRDIRELHSESAAELRKELQFRYFIPQVIRIDSIQRKSDLWLWKLQTDLGPTRLAMRNLHEHIQYPGGNRAILIDINGKRCEISDWRTLDSHSRRLLEEVL